MTLNFSRSEFACPCCGKDDISSQLVVILQGIRDRIERPIIVTSGVRCLAHNQEVGGTEDSEHMTGEGVDIACTSSSLRYKIIAAALDAGVTRIGIAKSFIHLGIAQYQPQEVVWLY